MPSSRNLAVAGTLFFTGLFLTATACASLIQPRPIATPAPMTPMPAATQTAIPLYQQVELQTSPRKESGAPFGYSIQADIPVLIGSEDPRVQKFNTEMKAVVDDAIARFKENVANLPPSPSSTQSTFELHYNLLSPPGDILSLKFEIQTYYSGAAHPGDTSRTITYDLVSGRDLDLSDLFLPDTDYLTALSKFSLAQLGGRDIGFEGFELGATASPENYRNWNITSSGLMITFDEYQVAPYAAGPQIVVVPYGELAALIRPDGPLGPYLTK